MGKMAIHSGEQKSLSCAIFAKSEGVLLLALKFVILQWNCRRGAENLGTPSVVALGVCIRARKKDSLLTVESRLRLIGSVSSERGWDSKNRRRGSWFTHRDGAFSSKPVKALGDDRLWELANGQGDPLRRCRFTTSWKAIPVARLIFLASLRCTPRRRWSRGAQSGVDFLSNNKFEPANPFTTDRSSAFPRSSNGCFISIGRF